MVEQAEYIPAEEKGWYGELQVLHSGGGYYVGTLYHDPAGYVEPGSRDSEYFRTPEAAKAFLQSIIEDGAPTRMDP